MISFRTERRLGKLVTTQSVYLSCIKLYILYGMQYCIENNIL